MKLSELLVRYLDIRDKLNSDYFKSNFSALIQGAALRDEAINILSQIDQIVELVDVRLDNPELKNRDV